MSPGLRSRPSLSVGYRTGVERDRHGRVAGTTVPAFVERGARDCPAAGCLPGVAGTTVPAFVERYPPPPYWHIFACVAGTTVPAFVERHSTFGGLPIVAPRVAGTTVPAFVERRTAACAACWSATRPCRRDYGPGLR